MKPNPVSLYLRLNTPAMKQLIAAIFLLLGAQQAMAQIPDIEGLKKHIFLSAKRMDEALMNKDYDTYSEYMHPHVIETTDKGRVGIVLQTKRAVENIEKSGNYITAIWPGTSDKISEIIDTAGQYQCTLPNYLTYRLPNGKLHTQAILVGVSMDKGKKWHFIDASEKTLEQLRSMFPELSSRLVIPATPQPRFEAE